MRLSTTAERRLQITLAVLIYTGIALTITPVLTTGTITWFGFLGIIASILGGGIGLMVGVLLNLSKPQSHYARLLNKL